MNREARGHLAALITILLWAMTYISTKVLLEDFQPAEILLLRTALGYVTLVVLSPRPLKTSGWKQELLFAAAGISGVTIYYLLQNIALSYTLAANVSIILSTAPFFTALLGWVAWRDRDGIRPLFFVGFVLAIAGIAMLSLGGENAELHIAGDLMTLASAIVWGCYALLSKKIGAYGFSTLRATRRIFFWGLLFMLPIMPLFGLHITPEAVLQSRNLLNLLYLGVGASALCFVTWNYAVKMIGAVATSVYIYIEPVITVISSALILREPISGFTIAGIALTLIGLILSGKRISARIKAL